MSAEKLGSFTLQKKIGAGAMGQVYLAIHDKTNRTAAVKVISNDQLGKGRVGDRFEREAEILKQFSHPNIVRFYAVGKSKGRPYIAMEFIDGGTLETRLEKDGPLEWKEVVDIGIQVCDALQYAHTHGVIHRDLKPSNLMIAADGTVKLTDFGIAKDLDATALTATGRTLGTAAYMAPEQIRGTPAVSHKTDLYSLGCVLYQLLTGEMPFQGPTAVVLMHKHLNEPPTRPSTRNPQIPKALDTLILSLLAKPPADRPWDAAAVAQKLTELRDKVEKGQAVPMVFGAPATPPKSADPLSPTQTSTVGANARFVVESPNLSLTGTTAKKKKKKRKSKEPLSKSQILGTAGLVGGLLLVLGLIVWQLIPPSAEKLYTDASKLMASSEVSDWTKADREFLADLDRLHPNHPYQEQVKAWRERTLLEQTRRRADVMEKSSLHSLSEPKTEAEALFAATAKASREAVQAFSDLTAERMWREMATQLQNAKDAEPRGWLLLANQRADQIRESHERRRREAARLLEDAVAANLTQEPALALRLRQRVVKDYAKYPDLADIVETARQQLPPDSLSENPAPKENPSQEPADPPKP
jgi:serine/threonine-protein kinase